MTLQKASSIKPRNSTLYKRTNSSGLPKDEMPSPNSLSHPLYRSQSLDALKRVQGVKEHTTGPFMAKRTQSEMKPETRKDGGKGKKGDRNSKSFVHDVFDKIAGSISASRSSSRTKDDSVNGSGTVVSEAIVHNDEEHVSKRENIQFVKSAPGASSNVNEPQMSNSASEFASLMDEMLDLKQENAYKSSRLSLSSDIEPGLERGENSLASPVSISPPNKPERKNKRQESWEGNIPDEDGSSNIDKHREIVLNDPSLNSNAIDIGADEAIQPSTALSLHSQPFESQTSEVAEDVIQPSVSQREIKIGDDCIIVGSIKLSEVKDGRDLDSALNSFSQLGMTDSNLDKSLSSEGDEIEEETIEATVAKRDSSAPLTHNINKDKVVTTVSVDSFSQTTDAQEKDEENKVKEEEKPKQPALDEEMLERLIAMNSYAPGTQGWAGIHAGGEQGGVVDDFIPNSRLFMAQPIPKEQLSISTCIDGESSSRPMSPPSVAYEIRDDVISGKPVAVEINKTKNVTRSSSYNTVLDDSSSTSSFSSSSAIEKNKSTSLRDGSNNYIRHSSSKNSNSSNSSSNISNMNNNEPGTPLSWSGQRLVRAGSFTDIPANNSVSDWTEKINLKDDDGDDTRLSVDELTDSDSEEFGITDTLPVLVPQVNVQVKDSSNGPNAADTETKPKKQQLSDMSMSASSTSSSGEATPPYKNGQEISSSPDFSLPTPSIHIFNNEISAVGKGNSFSLSLDDNKSNHEDFDC